MGGAGEEAEEGDDADEGRMQWRGGVGAGWAPPAPAPQIAQQMVAAGVNRGFRGVNWDLAEANVKSYKVHEMEMRRAPNRILLLKDYILEGWGDPLTNGHGHEVIKKDGLDCVRILGKMEWAESEVTKQGVQQERGSNPCAPPRT